MLSFFDAIKAQAETQQYVTTWTVLPGNQRPWRKSGLVLARGQHYTLLADGVIHWSERHPQLHGGPGFHLWARVHPGGRIVNVTRQSGSFVADVDGELELGIYLGMWQDDFGALATPQSAYARLHGELPVIAIRWPGTAQHGLEKLSGIVHHPGLDAEIARLRSPAVLPAGWDYLRETGITDIYRSCDHHGRGAICLDARDDQGIIRKAVDWALTPTTSLHWRWRLDQHPSEVAEDTHLTHDYVSLAAEFDNGRDLTWIWSSSLARDYHFHCPIKVWQKRETHWVVRTGEDPRSCWLDEYRRVHDDVNAAMGPPPSRIVGIWLICVATFQHGTAHAAFTGIELVDGNQRLSVL